MKMHIKMIKTFTTRQHGEAMNKIIMSLCQPYADGRNCAICGDSDHQAFECLDNPLVQMSEYGHYKCYHCGELFTGVEAQEHFGINEQTQVKCISDLKKANTPPEKLRSAKDSDLQEGAVIWHERKIEQGGPFWNFVKERRFANDPYKAYYADDGNSYGLYGAFVEV